MNDERYGMGKICQWHGPITFAAPAVTIDRANDVSEPAVACPVCGNPLIVTTADAFWSTAAASEKAIPEYVAMLKWSEGKCFQDYAAMQDAYRQAMEQ